MTSLEHRILYRLRKGEPLDVFEIKELIRANLHDVRVAARSLNERGLVYISMWRRRNGAKRIAVYMAGEGVNAVREDFDLMDRMNKARAENAKTVRRLRATAQPGTFDPFRGLRAQVGS